MADPSQSTVEYPAKDNTLQVIIVGIILAALYLVSFGFVIVDSTGVIVLLGVIIVAVIVVVGNVLHKQLDQIITLLKQQS